MAILIPLLAVAGLAVGSFVNVLAHRLPRGESVIRPGSHCPACGAPVRPLDNIPLLSWVLLRGRCRSCGEPISPRYPLVEAVTAVLWGVCGAVYGLEPELAAALVLVTVLVGITATDLEHRIIPNRVVLPAAIVALPLVAWADTGDLVPHLIAGLAAGLPLALISFAKPGAMGMGDAKLAGLMGLYLGRAVAPALLIGFAAGALVGVAIIARKGSEGRKQAVPFGPFLALGGVVALFVGDDIVEAYLDAFVRA